MKVLVLIILAAFIGCKSGKKANNGSEEMLFVPQYIAGPQALVYKTNKDYSNLVPVLLSDDKSEIVSYPHPSDIKTGDTYPLPTSLKNGYLLDNRGIGQNVAFLRLTYKEYSELKEVPSLKELYSYIIDKDPLTELCDCGSKSAFTDIEKQLNLLIEKKMLKKNCKVIK